MSNRQRLPLVAAPVRAHDMADLEHDRFEAAAVLLGSSCDCATGKAAHGSLLMRAIDKRGALAPRLARLLSWPAAVASGGGQRDA